MALSLFSWCFFGFWSLDGFSSFFYFFDFLSFWSNFFQNHLYITSGFLVVADPRSRSESDSLDLWTCSYFNLFDSEVFSLSNVLSIAKRRLNDFIQYLRSLFRQDSKSI